MKVGEVRGEQLQDVAQVARADGSARRHGRGGGDRGVGAPGAVAQVQAGGPGERRPQHLPRAARIAPPQGNKTSYSPFNGFTIT